MRKVLFGLFFLASCSDEILIAEKKCGAPCAIVDGATLFNEDALAATCRPGTSSCEGDDEKTASCPGYIPPEQQELCGGFEDDDCNPETTEQDIFIAPGMPGNTCPDTELGVCKQSYLVCVNGQMVCDHRNKTSEVCDSNFLDEDCNGLVNEDDPGMVYTIPLFRYDGDIDTANVGACRPGVARCVDGVQTYEGMVLPRAEECGNNIDDDCDGFVDEITGQVSPRSFLLLVDYSGSMFYYIQNVEEALCDWSITRPNDFFGIGGFGVSDTENVFEYKEIVPFVTAVDACNAISSTNPFAGGDEYAAKAGLLFLEDNYWPTTDRNIIIFSDEEFQQYSQAETPSFIQECSESSIELGVYTDSSVSHTYDELLTGCNGWVDYLSTTDDMVDSLSAHFAGHCSR